MTTTSSRRTRFVVAASAVTVGALSVPTLAFASAAGAATTAQSLTPGTCTGSSSVTMQLQRTDLGKLEAGFEVDHARPGSTWQITLRHNGTVYFSGRRTAGRDGSFSVDRVVANGAGIDHFSGRAKNLASGQVCSVSASTGL